MWGSSRCIILWGSSPCIILGGSSLGSLVGGLVALDSGSGLGLSPVEVLISATFCRETETVRLGCSWPYVGVGGQEGQAGLVGGLSQA